MGSLLRPLLTYILCGIVLLGQIPAILHVSICDSAVHRVDSAESGRDRAAKSLVCSHAKCGFHRHGADRSTLKEQEGHSKSNRGADIPTEHDSDSCAVCQSLFSPVGVTWTLEVVLELAECVELNSVFVERLEPSSTLLIAQPRGPPILAC